MASNTLDQNGDCVNDQEHLHSTDGSDAFGESYISPRIGDEYQAELPQLVDKSNYISNPDQYVFNSLPVPVTWISMKNEGLEIVTNGEIKSRPSPEEEAENLPAEEKLRKCKCEGYLLVPGLRSECLSDAEKASFTLGLYIFQKDFMEVSRFVVTEEVGRLLSFYYGRFYGSDEYIKWSDCRKKKSKKRVYGKRLFSGLRQQELLSRLLPRVAEEYQSSLVEVSKKFGDEKMSLVEYVSSLKSIAGLNILVEAVGIGTGKRDLTRMALEPSRLNQVGPTHLEIPVGRACSSLTTSEIINFLAGDYRLSKARSNDLFWEAVWPRLLARGWHSEQPNNRIYYVDMSKQNCLVFLMPGIEKFSRRKLVRGDQYFDSVTDVLSRVAREPELIELGNEEANGNKNEAPESTNDRKLEKDENELLTEQKHLFLQPRTHHNQTMDVTKFTVVDTSLPYGKVREFRSLPREIPLDRDGDHNQDIIDAGYRDISKTSVPGTKNKKDRLNVDKKCGKPLKPLLSRKQKRGCNTDHIIISKHCRRFTANSPSTGPTSENRVLSSCHSVQKTEEDSSSQVSPCKDNYYSSKVVTPSESTKRATENIPHTRLLIDLNSPQVSRELDNDVLAMDSRKEEDDLLTMPDDHEHVNPQRHSRRNRPLTNRALEAIAHGYLTVNRRAKKGRDDDMWHEDVVSRPLQRARVAAGPGESLENSVGSHIEEAENALSELPEASEE